MYQVRVLVDKSWKVLSNDTKDRDYIFTFTGFDMPHAMCTKYSDAADIFDYVQLEFHDDPKDGDEVCLFKAIKLVKVTPSGREISVERYKDLIRRKK